MATKNYGLGYREMGRAGEIALGRACAAKAISFATADKYADDWKQFCAWAKEHGAKQMERITPDMVRQYGRELAAKADDNIIKPSRAQDRITAVNRVMQLAGSGWTSISSTKDCGISKRSHIREGTPAALNRSLYQEQLSRVKAVAGLRGVAICELARNLGLRPRYSMQRQRLKKQKSVAVSASMTEPRGAEAVSFRSPAKRRSTLLRWPYRHRATQEL